MKLFASAQATERNVTSIKTETYQVGASMPVTPTSNILMSWTQTRTKNPVAGDIMRKTAAVGYDYFLSKRTDVYAIALYDKLTANPSGRSLATGIRHSF